MIKLEGKTQVIYFTQGNLIISVFVSLLVTLLTLQLQHKNTGTSNFATLYFGFILYSEEKLLFKIMNKCIAALFWPLDRSMFKCS